MKKNQKFELAKLDANELKELDGWKEKMETAVVDYPFVEITDSKSYDQAKKNRTGLRSARTVVQKQDKVIGSFLSAFRKETKNINEDLVLIVQPGEVKQQTEVSRWETILEEKANERQLEEENRIKVIKEKIEETKISLSGFINNMKFDSIGVQKRMFEDHVLSRSGFDYQEYEVMFDEMISYKNEDLEQKVLELEFKEDERIEQLKKDQQAEVNRRSVSAQKLIDLSDPTNQHELLEAIEEVFKPRFDFGDCKDDNFKSYTEMINKGVSRIKWIQSNEETEQRNKVIKVREGLLDIIYQMDVNDYEEKTNYVNDALDQSPASVLMVKDEFDKMVSRVKDALEKRLEAIATEIKNKEEADGKRAEKRISEMKKLGFEEGEKDFWAIEEIVDPIGIDDVWDFTDDEFIQFKEGTKESIRIYKRTEQRKAQLTEMGLKWNEADQYFNEEGIDNVTKSVIDELEFTEWTTYVQSLKILMEQFKDSNVEYQKRIERLKLEKEALIDWIDKGIRKTSMSGKFKQPEMIEFKKRISSELDLFCNRMINDLKEL